MIVLAIDSTMSGCSTCIYDDEEGYIASKSLEMTRGQAEHLIPMINSVIEKSGYSYNDLDLIAVTKGPGAFTGMRIGLATAKSLGLVLDIPVLGVSTFSAILETYLSIKDYKTYHYYGVLLETKRSDYYFQMFEGDNMSLCIDAMVGSAQDIKDVLNNKNCIILGDAYNRFISEVELDASVGHYDITMPNPCTIASIAIKNYKNNSGNIDASPVYLRLPEIGVAKNKPRKLK